MDDRVDFILVLHEAFPELDGHTITLKSGHIFAWVEQRVHNNIVRDSKRDFRCQICGSEM